MHLDGVHPGNPSFVGPFFDRVGSTHFRRRGSRVDPLAVWQTGRPAPESGRAVSFRGDWRRRGPTPRQRRRCPRRSDRCATFEIDVLDGKVGVRTELSIGDGVPHFADRYSYEIGLSDGPAGEASESSSSPASIMTTPCQDAPDFVSSSGRDPYRAGASRRRGRRSSVLSAGPVPRFQPTSTNPPRPSPAQQSSR